MLPLFCIEFIRIWKLICICLKNMDKNFQVGILTNVVAKQKLNYSQLFCCSRKFTGNAWSCGTMWKRFDLGGNSRSKYNWINAVIWTKVYEKHGLKVAFNVCAANIWTYIICNFPPWIQPVALFLFFHLFALLGIVFLHNVHAKKLSSFH